MLFAVCSLTMVIQGCGVNSNHMFKVAKGEEQENSDSIPMVPTEDYTIAVNDKISFFMTTNEGAMIVEGMSGVDDAEIKEKLAEREYEVRKDGKVDLPLLGPIDVEGLTIEKCEDTLEYFFSQDYKEPYVQVKVTNQRVIVFPGNGSDARVIPLQNTNTTLMEVIAIAGGITDRGRASKVKLMRSINGERKVFVMDLSVIEGLKFADLIVQANDYIYVEPTPEFSKELAEDVVPIISILSGTLIVVAALNNLK